MSVPRSVISSSITRAGVPVVLAGALFVACDGNHAAGIAEEAGTRPALDAQPAPAEPARPGRSDAATSDAAGGLTSGTPEASGAPDDPEPVLTAVEREKLLSLSPWAWPSPPSDPTNRFADDARAATLGEKFFFDTSFSGKLLSTDHDGTPGSLGRAGDTGKVACASCHVRESGFSDSRSFQRQISLGAGWGRRRAPSLLDVGQSKLIMWDGRRDSLFEQIFGPLESVVEMNSSRLYLAERIAERYQAEYEALFGPLPPLGDAARFPQIAASVTGCEPKHPTEPLPSCDGPFHGMPGDGAEFDSMAPADQLAVTAVAVDFGKAVGAFERRLSCGPGAFDAWIHGDTSALSRPAQRGAALFAGKGECVTCHSGAFLSDEQFHNVGLAPQIVQQAFIDSDDRGAATGIAALLSDPLSSAGRFSDGADGRLPPAVTPAMEGAFRTPKLRCVGSRPAFMHTGQLGTLEKVVTFFDRGGDPSLYPGTSEIHSLGLSGLEQRDLVAFLKSLDARSPDGG
jgi:cytochrome c peroxidase